MTEKEKMLSGMLYDPGLDGLPEMRTRAHDLCRLYNTLSENDEKRQEILSGLLPQCGENVYLQGPIQFDYGHFTEIGANSYANFNFTCLDCAPVTIGKNVFMGPNVSLLTPKHPLRCEERNLFRTVDGRLTDLEYAKPIVIGDNCWLAGNVTVCGGVTIGEGCVIGAGSVVTRNIPPHTLAVGIPCRPLRPITEADSLTGTPEVPAG